MIKAIIFDCYGVLVVNGWDYYRDHFLYGKPDKQKTGDDLYKQYQYGFISNYDFEKQIAALSQIHPAEVGAYLNGMPQNSKLLAYIQQHLQLDYTLAMLSNTSRLQINSLFNAQQSQLFDVICLSAETGFIKPDPRAYTTVAAQLDTNPPECLFIDDQLSNVRGAEAVGMQAIQYNGAQHTIDSIKKVTAAGSRLVPSATDSDHSK